MNANIYIYYFSPLYKENIKKCNFIKLYINFNILKVYKYTDQCILFNILTFTTTSTPVNEKKKKKYNNCIKNNNWLNLFAKKNINSNISNTVERYLVTVITIKNMEDLLIPYYNVMTRKRKKVVTQVIKDVTTTVGYNFSNTVNNNCKISAIADRYMQKIKKTHKYNSETYVYGKSISCLYKTNYFLTFLNNYILKDLLNLTAVKYPYVVNSIDDSFDKNVKYYDVGS
ncbi:conserved membrane protein, unknown function, partial [Hepatocystis sp. ex Piliocolobus tephrosceles]